MFFLAFVQRMRTKVYSNRDNESLLFLYQAKGFLINNTVAKEERMFKNVA